VQKDETMPNTQLAGQSQIGPLSPENYEEYMTWRTRWYLIVIITIAYTLALIGGLVGFGITKDPRYFLFIAPTALIPFVHYLVPMDKKKYDLEMAKIHANKELAELRLRVQMLESELGRQQSSGSTSLPAKQ
jgi:hypothetical protein